MKKKVVFMLTRPVFWNIFNNLYAKFEASEEYEPVVFLCGETINHIWAIYKNEIPKEQLANKEEHLITHDFNQSIQFAKKHKLNYISGFDQVEDKWTKLEDLNPALVFYCDPYDGYYLQNDWQPMNASKVYKTAYIHYCYLLAHTMEFYKRPIFTSAWKVFIESIEHTKIAEKELGRKVDNFINFGYPKFDDYYTHESNFTEQLTKFDSKKHEKLYVFAPHWTVSPKVDRTIGWYGNFNRIYNDILDLIKENPRYFWVFKPHPLLYPQLAHNYGKEEADKMFNLFRQLENVEFYEGHNYIDLFKASDGLLLDSNSFVAEYMPSGNRIIFIQKKEELKFNAVGTELIEACYRVNVDEDIQANIRQALFCEDDIKFTIRSEMVDKFIINDKELSPSDQIYRYIVKEFNKE